jgi:hypothetical protein
MDTGPFDPETIEIEESIMGLRQIFPDLFGSLIICCVSRAPVNCTGRAAFIEHQRPSKQKKALLSHHGWGGGGAKVQAAKPADPSLTPRADFFPVNRGIPALMAITGGFVAARRIVGFVVTGDFKSAFKTNGLCGL